MDSQEQVVAFSPAAPQPTDIPPPSDGYVQDDLLLSMQQVDPKPVAPVQDVNKMALSLEAASAGRLSYDAAHQAILREGPNPQTIRDLAAATYYQNKAEHIDDFNTAANKGMVFDAEMHARKIEDYSAAIDKGISDRKAAFTVVKEGVTNATISNETITRNNTIDKIRNATTDQARLAASKELLDQWMVNNGITPSGWEVGGVIGGALVAPLAIGAVSSGAGLAAGVGVGAKFSWDSFVTIPKSIEEVSGIKSELGKYAHQIDTWRNYLKLLPAEEAAAQFEAVAKSIADKEMFGKGAIGKVFAAMNIMRLSDAFEESDFPALSLKVQETLDQIGLGADVLGALQLIHRGSSTISTIGKTSGGKTVGKLVGEDLLNGTRKLNISNNEQTGLALSFDLSKYMPDTIKDASPEIQKAIETQLEKVLESLHKQMTIMDDPEALALRDYLSKNSQFIDKSMVSYNMQTGELVMQHPSGSVFHSKANAESFARKFEEQSGIKLEVVPAGEHSVTKAKAGILEERINDIDSGLVTLIDEAATGAFDPFGPGRFTAQALMETIENATDLEKGVIDVLKNMGGLDNVKVNIVESMRDWSRILPKSKLDQLTEKGAALHGYYDWRTNTLFMHKDVAASRSLAVHETLHAAISQVVDVIRSGNEKAMAAAKITGAQRAAVSNLRSIYEDVQWQIAHGIEMGDFSHADAAIYGMQDVHEMISEAFTNKAFQDLLKRITLSEDTQQLLKQADKTFAGRIKTAWDAVTKAFAKALGVPLDKENALQQVIENATRLLKNTSEEQQSVVMALKRGGFDKVDITEMLDTTAKAAALSHGWYVRRSGSVLAHDAADIESRIGGLDPIHSASERSVHDRTFQLHQSTRDRAALAAFLESGFKGVSRKEMRRVIGVLEKGDALGVEFNAIQLAAEGLSDKGQRAYFTYRTLSNIDLALKNIENNKELMRAGYLTQGHFSFEGLPKSSPARYVQPAEANGRKAFNLLTKKLETVDSSKLGGNVIFKTQRPITMGSYGEYTMFIGAPSDFKMGKLVDQIPNLPGSFRRVYTDDYFGAVKMARTIDGETAIDTVHLRTSKSGADIAKWSKGMDTILKQLKNNASKVDLAFIETHVGKWENAQDIMDAIKRGDWDGYESFTHHYDRSLENYLQSLTKGLHDDVVLDKSRGMKLQSIDANKVNTLDPIKAIQAEYTNVSRIRSMNEWKNKWVETWWNSFSHLVPDHVKNKYRTPLEAISSPEMQTSLFTGVGKEEKFAYSQLSYLRQQLGIKSLDENILQKAMERFTASWSSESILGNPLITAGHVLRNADPLQFIRSFNFLTMLSAFNPAQLIVQGAGALNAIAVSPIHGMKAAFTAPLLRVALMSDNPAVWQKVATLEKMATLGLSNAQEFSDMIRAIKKMGFLDNMVATSMHGAEAGAFNMLTGFANNLGSKTAFFFNRGEEFSRLVAFDVARREWMAANSGVSWLSDGALRHITTRMDDLTQNMTKSNLAFYQRGLLSIPGQFLQYNIKLANNLAGASMAWANSIKTGKPPVYRGFSMKEASSILGAHIIAYGLAGNGMMSLADELTGGYEKLVGRKMSDDEKLTFSQGLLAGLINEVSQLTTGEDTKLAIGKRLGVFEYYNTLAKSIWKADASFWQVVLGPSYGSASRLGALKELVMPFARSDYSASSFAEGLAAVGKETFSGWKNVSKAYYAQMHNGLVQDRNGQPTVVLTPSEIIAQAIGIGSAAEFERFDLVTSIKERNLAVKDFAKEWVRTDVIRMEVLKNGDKDRSKALTTFMASLHSKLTPEEHAAFWNEVAKLQKDKSGAWKDQYTKMRSEYLQGQMNITDHLTTTSYGMQDKKPVIME